MAKPDAKQGFTARNYNFERFTVLVVEDNGFIKGLIVSSLNTLGVGNVKTASDGGEAIELLRLMKNDPGKAGMMHVDIVLTNWQMEPIEGLQLLRWIRRSKESPDRFMPVIMITGSADKEKVAEARDMGVTEFLAKPFSAAAICQRLYSVIEHPRPFLQSKAYFGPDRRRQDLLYSGEDKRSATKADMEVVYDK